MGQWTSQRRLRQAQLIQQWKPWLKAGVKTPEGKAISKMNALKHGGRSAEMKELMKLMGEYKREVRALKNLV